MTHEILVALELLACAALILSTGVFMKNAYRLTQIAARCDLQREHEHNEALLKQFHKRLARLEGTTVKTHIEAKIAQKFSQLAHASANGAVAQVGALEKSTHKVQFMPVEKLLERNGGVAEEIDKILNPSREAFDWFGDEDDLND